MSHYSWSFASVASLLSQMKSISLQLILHKNCRIYLSSLLILLFQSVLIRFQRLGLVPCGTCDQIPITSKVSLTLVLVVMTCLADTKLTNRWLGRSDLVIDLPITVAGAPSLIHVILAALFPRSDQCWVKGNSFLAACDSTSACFGRKDPRT